MANQNESGTTQFRPRARIISLIGEELISDEQVALVELVKNAYDADASRVNIIFETNSRNRYTSLSIEDDGDGMSLDTVLGAWLEPGTVHKKRKSRSKRGRLYQGAKGIGRFATARLGASLMMETKAKRSSQVISVLTHWGNFDDDSYLDDIDVEYEVNQDKARPAGTCLHIDELSENVWSKEEIQNLHSRLSRLLSPFREIDDFAIYLETPLHPEFTGEIQPPELLARPKYLFTGEVKADGAITGSIKVAGKSKAIPKSRAPRKSKSEQPACGPFSFEIRAWDRDDLDDLAAHLDQSVAYVKRALNQYSGVSMYRDGFRVHPYGEPGNDWLRLDLRSRLNPTRNLANNQLIVSLKISREHNPDLRDRSTREGLIQNDSYDAIVDWFKQVLTLLEEERYKLRRPKSVQVRVQPIFEALDISDTVKEVEAELGERHPVTKIFHQTAKQITDGSEKIQESFSRLLMSAGLGHMIDIVIHEIGSPLGKMNREILIIERQLIKMLTEKQMSQIGDRFDSIRAWMEQLHNLRQRLDPQTAGKRGKATKFDVTEDVQSNIDFYKVVLEKNDIRVNLTAPRKPLEVKMSRAVLSQVVVNLLDNSIYWVIDHHGRGRGGTIDINIKRLNKGFQLKISDDGLGVADENRDQIFEPYFSTKPNGMGLGLHIVRMLMEPYGRLLLEEHTRETGATFVARFEQGVGL